MTEMKTISGFLALLLLFSCGKPEKKDRPEDEYMVCACDREKMGEWVLQCIEKMEPHVGEAGDIIRQCEKTAVKIHCGEACYKSVGGAILRQVDYEQDPRR